MDTASTTAVGITAADVDAIMSELVFMVTHTRMAFVSDESISDRSLGPTLESTMYPIVESLTTIDTMNSIEIAGKIQQVIASGTRYALIVSTGLSSLVKLVRLFRTDPALRDQIIKYVHDFDLIIRKTKSNINTDCELAVLACELVLVCVDGHPMQTADSAFMALDTCRIASSFAYTLTMQVAQKIVRALGTGAVEDAVVTYISERVLQNRSRGPDEVIWMLHVAREFVQSRRDDASNPNLERLCEAMLFAINNKAMLVDVGLTRVLTAIFIKLPLTCSSKFELFVKMITRSGFARQADDGHNAVFLDALHSLLCVSRSAMSIYARYDCCPLRTPLLSLTVSTACDTIAKLHPSDNRCSYSFNYLRFVIADILRCIRTKDYGNRDRDIAAVDAIKQCATLFNNNPSAELFVDAHVSDGTPRSNAIALHTMPMLKLDALRRFIMSDDSHDTACIWIEQFELARETPMYAFSEILWHVGIPRSVDEINKLGDIVGRGYKLQRTQDTEPRTLDYWATVAKFIMFAERHCAIANGRTGSGTAEEAQEYLRQMHVCSEALNEMWLNGVWTEISSNGLFSRAAVMRHSLRTCHRRDNLIRSMPVFRQTACENTPYGRPSQAEVSSVCAHVVPKVVEAASSAFHNVAAMPPAAVTHDAKAVVKPVAAQAIGLLFDCVAIAGDNYDPDTFTNALFSKSVHGDKLVRALDFVHTVIGDNTRQWRPIVFALCNACNSQRILDALGGVAFDRPSVQTAAVHSAQSSDRSQSGEEPPPTASGGMIGRLAGAFFSVLQNADPEDGDEEGEFTDGSGDEELGTQSVVVDITREDRSVLSARFDRVMAKICTFSAPTIAEFVSTCAAVVEEAVDRHIAISALAIVTNIVASGKTALSDEVCRGVAAGIAAADEQTKRAASTCAIVLCRVANYTSPPRIRELFQMATVSDARKIPASSPTILHALAGLLGGQGMNLLATGGDVTVEMSLFRDIAGAVDCSPNLAPTKAVFAAVRRNSATLNNAMFELCAGAIAAHWTASADEDYTDLVCSLLHDNRLRLATSTGTGTLVQRLLWMYHTGGDSSRRKVMSTLTELLAGDGAANDVDARLVLFTDNVLPGLRPVVGKLDDAERVRLTEFVTTTAFTLAKEATDGDAAKMTALLVNTVGLLVGALAKKQSPPDPNDRVLTDFLNQAMAVPGLLVASAESTEGQMRWNTVWTTVKAKRPDIVAGILGDGAVTVPITT